MLEKFIFIENHCSTIVVIEQKKQSENRVSFALKNTTSSNGLELRIKEVLEVSDDTMWFGLINMVVMPAGLV